MLNLIFDFDGCLINSLDVQKEAFFGSYAEVVGDDNCPSFNDFLKHTGDSITNVMRKMGLPQEMANSFRRISSNSISKIKVNDDCIELIKEAKAKGSKIAICTGKDHYRVNEILSFFKISNLFDVIISSDDVLEPKPSPVPIFVSIDKLNVKKNSCVFIGDGFYDLLSARAAGVKSILTLWYGDEGVERISDAIAKSVNDLRKILYEWGL